MINTLYIESDIIDHPRTNEIRKRFRQATVIECDRYQQVFNPKSQSFRLQKANPALILAKKHNGFVLETPDGYGLGAAHNYYFSHMLNCVYDCRYCFLQGMYRSAHYIVFVNYEDFAHAITQRLTQHQDQDTWFFSGYDCDSLAFDPITRFVDYFLPLFKNNAHAFMELRTKSTQIRSLLKIDATPNLVVAFSFTPHEIHQSLEHKVPSIEKRIEAIQRLQNAGYSIGLRFDPMIYHSDYKTQYTHLFKQLFTTLGSDKLHSVSFGPFRLPKQFYKNIVKLYPDEPLFAGPLEEAEGMISYRQDLEQEMMSYCQQTLLAYIPSELLYPCQLPGNATPG